MLNITVLTTEEEIREIMNDIIEMIIAKSNELLPDDIELLVW